MSVSLGWIKGNGQGFGKSSKPQNSANICHLCIPTVILSAVFMSHCVGWKNTYISPLSPLEVVIWYKLSQSLSGWARRPRHHCSVFWYFIEQFSYLKRCWQYNGFLSQTKLSPKLCRFQWDYWIRCWQYWLTLEQWTCLETNIFTFWVHKMAVGSLQELLWLHTCESPIWGSCSTSVLLLNADSIKLRTWFRFVLTNESVDLSEQFLNQNCVSICCLLSLDGRGPALHPSVSEYSQEWKGLVGKMFIILSN